MTPRPTPRATTIAALLAPLPAARRVLVDAARARIRAVVPDATEALRAGWGLIGYNAPRYFAFVVPGPGDVRIGFEHGATLPDPAGLLTGDGRQVRHVVIRGRRDLRRPELAELLRVAAARG